MTDLKFKRPAGGPATSGPDTCATTWNPITVIYVWYVLEYSSAYAVLRRLP